MSKKTDFTVECAKMIRVHVQLLDHFICLISVVVVPKTGIFF